MATQALVSICIPVYNGEQHLGQVIESALAQRYEALEVVVVDNASVDDTASILADYAAERDINVTIEK